jgi:RNA exonuclease 4
VKSNRISLRNLVEQELGLTIQAGEHSSVRRNDFIVVVLFTEILSSQVTDARAAMAVYRLHRQEWESGVMPRYPESTKKRKRRSSGETANTNQVGERKGISSGSSVVVKNLKGSKTNANNDKWWLELGSSGTGQSKGSLSFR